MRKYSIYVNGIDFFRIYVLTISYSKYTRVLGQKVPRPTVFINSKNVPEIYSKQIQLMSYLTIRLDLKMILVSCK